ncbi:MAG: hypothetical protein KUG81_09895 [Gammaproteobacteria bacterium]|nr:hypothetical protein [Gammaproteobacteria bacterium]
MTTELKRLVMFDEGPIAGIEYWKQVVGGSVHNTKLNFGSALNPDGENSLRPLIKHNSMFYGN